MLCAESVSKTKISTLGMFADVFRCLKKGLEPAIHGVESDANDTILRNERRFKFGFIAYSQISKDNNYDGNEIKNNIEKCQDRKTIC